MQTVTKKFVVESPPSEPATAKVQHGSGTDTLTGERNVADRSWVPEHVRSA
jgi:hypothetical protein